MEVHIWPELLHQPHLALSQQLVPPLPQFLAHALKVAQRVTGHAPDCMPQNAENARPP